MPAPPAMNELYYKGLIAQKEPTDVPCELRVLAAVMGNPDALKTAMGYLEDDDFTDAEVVTTWHRLAAGFKSAGGEVQAVVPGSPLAEDLYRLRAVKLKREVERLGWTLALLAVKSPPDRLTEWCMRAMSDAQALGVRLREGGLIDDGT